ncbi:hypothetical protein DFH07DRAFT_768998 [Mycena maculata]|uniref:Uncharacterized protein n=1 Tax=Mycena maculata TaxID=230809 RepID=A0AAD7JTB1_9AGAR|nr:hypothetical protein DFH07DRAFT_768998 [Mycena maculata]
MYTLKTRKEPFVLNMIVSQCRQMRRQEEGGGGGRRQRRNEPLSITSHPSTNQKTNNDEHFGVFILWYSQFKYDLLPEPQDKKILKEYKFHLNDSTAIGYSQKLLPFFRQLKDSVLIENNPHAHRQRERARARSWPSAPPLPAPAKPAHCGLKATAEPQSEDEPAALSNHVAGARPRSSRRRRARSGVPHQHLPSRLRLFQHLHAQHNQHRQERSESSTSDGSTGAGLGDAALQRGTWPRGKERVRHTGEQRRSRALCRCLHPCFPAPRCPAAAPCCPCHVPCRHRSSPPRHLCNCHFHCRSSLPTPPATAAGQRGGKESRSGGSGAARSGEARTDALARSAQRGMRGSSRGAVWAAAEAGGGAVRSGDGCCGAGGKAGKQGGVGGAHQRSARDPPLCGIVSTDAEQPASLARRVASCRFRACAIPGAATDNLLYKPVKRGEAVDPVDVQAVGRERVGFIDVVDISEAWGRGGVGGEQEQARAVVVDSRHAGATKWGSD